MRLRSLASLVVVLAFAAALGVVHASVTSIPSASMCAPAPLSAPFHGPERVSDVVQYGCDDGWAYLWATVGSGAHAVGVTEVLRENSTHSRWLIASRLKVCEKGVMPNLIYRQGCFSN